MRAALASRVAAVRARSLALAAPLTPEDQQVQSMPDASPTKWHLAHTTWFFETFVLVPHAAGFAPFDSTFGYLFNSYYETVGPRHPRPARGLLTRPPLVRVVEWRVRTDEVLARLIAESSDEALVAFAPMIELGLNHEEQHQELILMDALHLLSLNPLAPAYAVGASLPAERSSPLAWRGFPGGLIEIGHAGDGFAFDNEGPRHKVWIEAYEIADRLVTNGEFREFVDAGGYRDPRYWLSDGWAWVAANAIEHPAYWRRGDDGWSEFTLRGPIPLDSARPVAHLSHFEADAYARFRDVRLPTEAEWENAACHVPALPANFLDSGALVATGAGDEGGLRQMFGDLWEWTGSAYSPYPGFVAAAGAVGEYNGKFMSGQMVLRGGCCATPAGHARATYRNFFYPHQRWMFSGVRLARDT
ncbi:MAG TPA: ergothioneine biosynthesis protein EgtB [Alphaproteobacteria bacterium]|nr:ergothioneine biosynthesis protein EgtB [Alphaproteobacteria bacterium]